MIVFDNFKRPATRLYTEGFKLEGRGKGVAELAIQCPQCKGTGHIRVQAQTTSLSSAQPTYEERLCNDCAGTGRGQPASADDLHRYFGEQSQAPEDLFALARTVAASCRCPTNKETRTERIQVSYGFLGRKSRSESVTRETETDYWVLATKKGWNRRQGSMCDHGSCLGETDDVQTVFCLATDGSFRKLQRTQETVDWDASNGYRSEALGWSGWEAQRLTDLDHFMVDFDFDGSITAEEPGHWSGRTEVVGDMDFYLKRGNDPHMRRVYPKGVGLYVALKGLADRKDQDGDQRGL